MVVEFIMRFEPGLKLACHSQLGKYLEGEFVAPINIEISPSGVCNANCPWCFYRQKNKVLNGMDDIFFNEERMTGLIEELSGMGVKSISWTGGGEPTLHPKFAQFAELTKWSGLKQGLFTNALGEIKYDPTDFEWIRVSKTDKPWPVENIKRLRDCKTLGLCINYNGPEDDHLIKYTLKIAEELNITYVQVRPALKIKGEKTSIVVPNMKHPLLLITDYKFLVLEERFNLGNVFAEGEKRRFRNIMKNSPKSVPVCDTCQVCCKLNAMNSMIHHVKELEDRDFP